MTTKTTTVVVIDAGGRGGGGGGGGRGSATTTTIIDDDAMHNSSGNGSGNVEAATTTTGPPSSGSGSPTYGMTPEQASREFDSLRREATKLERHLEDRVARYQQVRAGGRGVCGVWRGVLCFFLSSGRSLLGLYREVGWVGGGGGYDRVVVFLEKLHSGGIEGGRGDGGFILFIDE